MLIDEILKDLKQSQLNKDETKTSTLRLLLSEVKNAQIAKGRDLTDEEIIVIAQKEVKKRLEAAAGFRLGGKDDQALKEEAEQKVLESYLPVQLSKEALTKIVESSITELGASSIQDMGRVMGAVMGQVKGQADGGVVSAIVKEKLS